MNEDEIRGYYNVLAEMWKLFLSDLRIVDKISDATDPLWLEIINRYEAVVNKAPAAVRYYADTQRCVHIEELEWRWRK